MKLMVYFNNGNCARVDAEKTVFVTGDHAFQVLSLAEQGNAVVNWQNVSFIRRGAEETED